MLAGAARVGECRLARRPRDAPDIGKQRVPPHLGRARGRAGL